MPPDAVQAQGIYVTGTDTGVGKTVASCALLHALRVRGLHAVGMKPVASGCERIGGIWRNEDARALIEASAVRTGYALHNPFALPAATAPQLAARDAGVAVTLAPIQAAYTALQAQADAVVVEGVGGWAAPLADGFEQADLVRALRLPVILVVGLRLGCLSHARLTARAIEADGIALPGWIGSTVDPDFDRRDDYLQLLRDALPVPCLGVLPHGDDAAAMASHLDVAVLA
jgi:dethiobiotin synthetase